MYIDESALSRVKQAIAAFGDLEIIEFDADTSTAELAARALGVEAGQIAKSLCFVGDGEPFLVIAAGDRKIDTRKLSRQLGKKKVKFADAFTVADATGFSPGGVCPFALKTPLAVYLDESLFQHAVVYAAAGTANTALPVAPGRLRDITGAGTVDAAYR
ncbi:MAG: YbaK/EbsC family protein [Acidaminococcales bacterium]|jgi:Cys-tRNA(Pro) deacylase|nr:YbaK/EbsC family protein [Acidaminococcales bacterium]